MGSQPERSEASTVVWKEVDVDEAGALLICGVSLEYKWKKDRWRKWPFTYIGPGQLPSDLFNPGEYKKLKLRVQVE